MRGVFPKLGQVQAASGVVFALFLFLHLFTTASAVLGIDSYNHTLGLLRQLYRPNLAVELTLIGLSGTVHLLCAILQFWRRRKVMMLRGPWWLIAHRLSGYFLLLVIIGHVLATRVAPTLMRCEGLPCSADFSYLAYATLWVPWFFWPYYLLLGLCGALHLGFGLYLARRILLPGGAPQADSGAARLQTFAAIALSMIVLAGVLGILLRVGDAPSRNFPAYRAFQQKLFG